MHEHYEDTPWREQAFYVADSRNQALCGYYAFGEYRFPAACFELYDIVRIDHFRGFDEYFAIPAEKERQLGAIIDEMNAILYQLQLTLSRVKAGTKPNPGEESKPTTPPASETPTEPEPEPEPEPENPDVV